MTDTLLPAVTDLPQERRLVTELPGPRSRALMERRAEKLGWRPQFPWEIIGGWIDARPDLALLERRRLAPLGLFTLARIHKGR